MINNEKTFDHVIDNIDRANSILIDEISSLLSQYTLTLRGFVISQMRYENISEKELIYIYKNPLEFPIKHWKLILKNIEKVIAPVKIRMNEYDVKTNKYLPKEAERNIQDTYIDMYIDIKIPYKVQVLL